MDSHEVHSLIAQAQRGDTTALGKLYDLYANRLYRFISFKIPTNEQAEDILQETFLKAWRALPKLSLVDLNFSAWLYKIARNLVNDYYRAVKRRPTPETIENYYDLTSSADTFKETATTFDLAILRQAVTKLSPAYRQILELRFIQEFSVEETAQIMGKTTVAVRITQHRAIKKLNSLLTQDHEPAKI